ncbi:MAG: methyltransferase domain-containing protein [Nanoarchaeota archaeon]|nr:methyltransferase domain-containing protein [Nanoarchaeota archaeon]
MEVKKISQKQLYEIWARTYDSERNLTMFLEEQITKELFSFKNKEILDLGCGTGRYSIPLARKNSLTAVDFSSAMLNKAIEKAGNENLKIEFINSDVIKFKPRKKYDIILSMLVHDHIKNLKKPLKVIEKASKIGTEVFISNVHPRFTYISKVKGNKAQLIQGYITDEYHHPLSEYLQIMRKSGFELIDCKEIILEEICAKNMHFENIDQLKNEFLGILYRFRKMR